MIVKSYYEDGRLDVFDTAGMAGALPGALLDCELMLRGIEEDGLWLNVYTYVTASDPGGAAGPAGLPVARRREGWCFLLADRDELKSLVRLVVDGRLALFRQGGELVDAIAYDHASDIACVINPQTVRTHDYLAAALSDEDVPGGMTREEAVCAVMGYSETAYERVRRMQARAEAPDDACGPEDRSWD